MNKNFTFNALAWCNVKTQLPPITEIQGINLRMTPERSHPISSHNACTGGALSHDNAPSRVNFGYGYTHARGVIVPGKISPKNGNTNTTKTYHNIHHYKLRPYNESCWFETYNSPLVSRSRRDSQHLPCGGPFCRSQLNGSHGEATNSDDVDNAERKRNHKEAKNKLFSRKKDQPFEDKKTRALVHEAEEKASEPDVVIEFEEVDPYTRVDLLDVWAPSSRSQTDNCVSIYLLLISNLLVNNKSELSALFILLSTYLLTVYYSFSLLQQIATGFLVSCTLFIIFILDYGVKEGVAECNIEADVKPVLSKRSDKDSWTYKSAEHAYQTQVCKQLVDSLVKEFYTSDSKVIGTANRMGYAAIAQVAKMRTHDDAEINCKVVNESVKYSLYRLRALQDSLVADTGVVRRPLVMPFG